MARPEYVDWRCPKCGRTENQPRIVSAVGHDCKVARKFVVLRRVEPKQ